MIAALLMASMLGGEPPPAPRTTADLIAQAAEALRAPPDETEAKIAATEKVKTMTTEALLALIEETK